MLKNNKPLFKLVVIVSLLCIVFCLVSAAYSMFLGDVETSFSLDSLFIILASLAAAYYMLGGYAKNAARYYKIFTAFAALSALVTMIDGGLNGTNNFLVITSALVFAITLYMTFSINQGKKRSLAFCGIAVALRFVDIIAYYLTVEAQPRLTALYVCYIVLSLLLALLTFAKYVDKDARGTI